MNPAPLKAKSGIMADTVPKTGPRNRLQFVIIRISDLLFTWGYSCRRNPFHPSGTHEMAYAYCMYTNQGIQHLHRVRAPLVLDGSIVELFGTRRTVPWECHLGRESSKLGQTHDLTAGSSHSSRVPSGALPPSQLDTHGIMYALSPCGTNVDPISSASAARKAIAVLMVSFDFAQDNSSGSVSGGSSVQPS